MSDDIDMNASNLCTTEDAFEQFQAVSMYQEDEYITLSDILPQKPEIPTPNSSEISQIPYNNEVVLTTSEMSDELNKDTTGAIERTVCKESSNLHLDSSTNMDVEQTCEIDTKTQPKKRGRKKKNSAENNSFATLENAKKSSTLHDSINNQVNKIETTNICNKTSSMEMKPRKKGRPPKRKRGRPPKKTSTQNITVPKYLSLSKTTRNITVPKSLSLSKQSKNSTPVAVYTNRARLKKQQNNLLVPAADSTTSNTVMSSKVSGSDNDKTENRSLNESRIPHKQRKGRKMSTGLDIYETQPPKRVNNIKTSDSEDPLSLLNKKSPVKRFKYNKKQEATSTLLSSDNVEQPNSLIKSPNKKYADVSNELSFSENDELDDISLSQLKTYSPAIGDTTETTAKCNLESITKSDEYLIDDCVNKTPNKVKKRGRAKKVPEEVYLESPVKSVPNEDQSKKVIQVEEDEKDDLCLSKLKETIDTPLVESSDKVNDNHLDIKDDNGTPAKRSTKMLIMSDFEYNIDSIVGNDTNEATMKDINPEQSLLTEDLSKRPVRRKVKQPLHYDEGSDEDPFANMESSDDEPRKYRKGNRYYSDDEYRPGSKRDKAITDSSDSEINEEENGLKKKKKIRKKSENSTPRKRGKKSETNKTADSQEINDIEEVLQSSVITAGDEHTKPQAWGSSNEFESFIAKKIQGTELKIKKVSSTESAEKNITPLEIPVINPETKKTVEMCSQTRTISTTSTSVQTTSPYDILMKENMTLTKEQSEKACYFLNSIVQTTAELGQLMTQKSEDFMKKKIHTQHVTDTFKMDYCVKKSFLLFKLAKHNLIQMEEDLAKQYEEFLQSNDLSSCREKPKEMSGKPKPDGNDSDCEIVEEIAPSKTPLDNKPKFNPKTVFLNKELSIKIAKKGNETLSNTQKKIDIKGRHTVWINDTVMVKKVKPTQSFLAQDSRNKKPPDSFVTTEMVSDFFKEYYRQRALTVCAPFISTEWRYVTKECVCNYFVVKPITTNAGGNFSANEGFNNSDVSIHGANNLNVVKPLAKVITCPETLFKLCFRILKNKMLLNYVKEVNHHKNNKLTDGKEQPECLVRLCLSALTDDIVCQRDLNITNTTNMAHCSVPVTVPPLKSLSYRKIVDLIFNATHQETQNEADKYNNNVKETTILSSLPLAKNEIKSLFSLCVEFIQNEQNSFNDNCTQLLTPNTLKHISFKNIKYLLYKNSENESSPESDTSRCHINQFRDEVPIGGLTINCVNTMSEEAFLNLEQSVDIPENSEYADNFDNDDSNHYDDSNFESNFNEPEDDVSSETNWVARVQMQEFRSCLVPNNTEDTRDESIITSIKLEPIDEPIETTPLVKTEPGTGLDEMTIIPDFDQVKPELIEDSNPRAIQRHNSSSYDVDTFENFVQSSKLMNVAEYNNEDIFSQSALRIRRQHEPDFDEDNDMDMGLLVPQTYESLPIETAKGRLMESSSDESNKNKKTVNKKKTEKRKTKPKKSNNKNVPTATKDKVPNNDVATLTRRMRDRIRQEEKKHESSDSENEHVSRILKNKKDVTEKTKSTQNKNIADTEIQCNNVDSTENATEVITEKFTGFTAIDQNETSSYQKFMKYVYDKIVDEVGKEQGSDHPTENIKDANSSVTSPLFEPNVPVEQLECEPTMPIFDDDEVKTRKKVAEKKSEDTAIEKYPFIERHGWRCYPVNTNDTKLYQTACISLEKLPESFVETYFRYQDITTKSKDDEEVDRLTNLNTLNRASNLKETKTRIKPNKEGKTDRASEHNSDVSRSASPANSERYDELTPSEDEGGKAEDELPPAAPRQTENTLAKDSLMNDSDSDAGTKIKQEPQDVTPTKTSRPSRTKPKVVPTKVENVDSESLMLTADKVMNKELTLLHAPVVLKDGVNDASTKIHATRSKQKIITKSHPSKGQTKAEEDSSSEEEKQWVTTKEKLLKRLGKKEDASVDDAKRAKLVSEFIERRGGNPDSHKRARGRPVRSRKKFLERQKQLKVLSRELFGEPSIDASHNKRSANAYFKGRRNIRKVIDKKSLARSTVIANMEEFERKRRLNARQTKLRELLGCEEGVNVLVINDEVCLEYDFEEDRPVVTIHPFFTKVMKAHQYEGVKFMWDACFESLSVLASGHPGGGCILAHCMGLGKTLQVLALLHTVLTHPRVGMRRVLVCCPLSTVLNWVDEIHKWIGPVTNAIKVFELSKLKKTYERAYQLEDWYNGGGIFIIGYELFRSLSTLDPFLDDVRPTIVNKIRTALLDPGPDIIVCDEGHLLKNDCSVLAVAMSRVVTKRRIVLTGTPMQNNLREYYCMVDFVKPNLLGTYSEYSNRFENPIMNGQHRDSREEDIKLMKARTHILHKVLEGCLQRQEASVLYPYLPKKHEYTVFIPLTKCQWDMYKHYLTYYGKQGKQSILKDFHILHKIWSHPQVYHNFQTKAREERIKKEKLEDDLAHEDQEDIKPNMTEMWWLPYLDDGAMLDSLDSSNKFMVVFRILDECVALGDKVLIFSTSLFCLDGLEYFLKKINNWSLGQDYYRLDGSVPAEVRQKWCREFNADNNEKTKLFLVSTRAGCLGLNMTAANRVIILDTSWNPAHDIQSIFRVYRFGQKKDCFIYRLVAMGTMEQKIYERSVTKQAVACRVVDEQQIDRHYNSTDLTELYRYDESGSSVACGVAAGVGDVALLRVARAAALHAVHEHDSLLRGSEPALPEHERALAWHQFQQEQEDKQVQNKLISIPRIKKRTTARMHDHEYVKPPLSPQEIKDEDKSNDYVAPWERKNKKGKKSIEKCSILFPENTAASNTRNKTRNTPDNEPTKMLGTEHDFQQPGTSKDTPSSQNVGNRNDTNEEPMEDEMVQKITDILIQHDFHNKKMEIGSLISEVRYLVSKGKWENSEAPNKLSHSIAEVLLGQKTSITQPTFRNIMSESICSAVNNPATEQITGDLKDKELDKIETRFDNSKPKHGKKDKVTSRTKRKAVIETKVDDDVIDLGDDDDIVDPEYRPDTYEEVQVLEKPSKKGNNSKTKNSKPDLKEQSKSKTVTNTPDDNKASSIEKSKEIREDNSILLSDDEEPATEKSNVPTEIEDDEEVALPISLLTNKNFIKIVAHTYSAGNPMLDEDAATLAAQYSTFRALSEVKQTGKPIVNGPIYDIAVSVLGKPTLKKLLTVNDNVKKSAENTAAMQFKENIIAFESSIGSTNTSIANQRISNVRADPPRSTPTVRLTSTNERMNTVPAPSTSNVVPVGLIKRVVATHPSEPYGRPPSPSGDECILPDDDNVFIMDSPPNNQISTPAPPKINTPAPPKTLTPAPPKTLTPAPPKTLTPAPPITPISDLPRKHNTYTKTSTNPNIKPLILNHMLSTTRKETNVSQLSDAKANKPTIQISSGRVVLTGTNKQASSSQSDTICLDSDEEDIRTTHVVNQSVTTAAVSVEPSVAQPARVAADAGVHPKRPLAPMVLQNKLTKGSKRKFVLVPAGEVPPAVLKVAEKSIMNTAKPQSAPQTTTNPTSKTDIVSPSVSSNLKISKTKCKPGDIFRISKTGQIQVLNIDDKVAEAIGVSDTANKPAPAPASVQTVASTSQTSNSTRASSPDNPLSILKNVVHIQAADDLPQNRPPKTANTIITKNEKYNANVSQQRVGSIDSKNQTSNTSSVNSASKTKIGGDKNRITIDVVSNTKQKCIGKVDKIRTYLPDTKIAQSKSFNKSKNDTVVVISKNKTSTKLPEKSGSTKIVGNLKNMVLDGSGKGVSVINNHFTVDLTGSNSIQVTKVTKIPSVNTKPGESKKRPASNDVASPTQKKKPMMLKDFDIEDIDDIIELD